MILSKPRLLYVEDEVILALNVADNLRREYDITVIVAHNLSSARSLIAKEAFDWALLDMNLGNSEQSVDLLNVLDSDGTHVVFASGYNQLDSTGGDEKSHIEKPFHVLDVARAFGFGGYSIA